MRKFMIVSMLMAVLATASWAGPLEVLQSDAGLEARMDACRMLATKGGPEAVPVLRPLLQDPEMAHMARYALQAMPCEEAAVALREALGTTDGPLKAGVITSLAGRGDVTSIPAIAALADAEDDLIATTAMTALSRLGTGASQQKLLALLKAGVPPQRMAPLCEALLRCAEASDAPQAIYHELLNTAGVPQEPFVAALRGIIVLGGENARAAIKGALGDSEARFEGTVRALRDMPAADRDDALLAAAEVYPSLADERKLKVIQVTGQLGGEVAGKGLLAVATAESGPLKVAALQALTRMGYTPALPLIEQLSWNEDEAVAEAARTALMYFPGTKGDAVLQDMLQRDDANIRRVAVDLVGRGGLSAPAATLMTLAAKDPDAQVRLEALKALRTHAGMPELAALLDRLMNAASDDERQAAKGALDALCNREKSTDAGDVAILRAAYGDLPEGKQADVTAKVAQMVAEGSMSIGATNANFGDAAPGVSKQLRVDYRANGVGFSRTVPENASLQLTAESVPPELVQPLLAAFGKAKGEAGLALIGLLGATGHPDALKQVCAAAKSDDQAVRQTALETICNWPAGDALPVVMDLAANPPEPGLKDRAIRGAMRLLNDTAGADALAEGYAALLASAGSPAEKKLVLSGLGRASSASAFGMALQATADEAVRAEALQAAAAIGKRLGRFDRAEQAMQNIANLDGWEGNMDYWRVQDGAIVGTSDTEIPRNEFLWAPMEVSDFYLVLDVKQTPYSANAGIQFRSKSVDEHGQAMGYQADVGEGWWGKLYHEHGRGLLDNTGTAGKAVKPEDWNRYEILAVGPAIWIAINSQLGAAFLDREGGEPRGKLALQVHSGAPQTVQYKIHALVHDPEVKLNKLDSRQLVEALLAPDAE